MKATTVSPTICPECGHRFPPGAPEPSRCPDCGRQCTGYGEAEEMKRPLPDEIPVTPEERSRWRKSFWGLFFIGPVFAVGLLFFSRDILRSLPPELREYAALGSHPLLPLCFSAVGAAFCLAKLWHPRRRFSDILAYAFLNTILVLAIYGLLFLAGVAIIHALGVDLIP